MFGHVGFFLHTYASTSSARLAFSATTTTTEDVPTELAAYSDSLPSGYPSGLCIPPTFAQQFSSCLSGFRRGLCLASRTSHTEASIAAQLGRESWSSEICRRIPTAHFAMEADTTSSRAVWLLGDSTAVVFPNCYERSKSSYFRMPGNER